MSTTKLETLRERLEYARRLRNLSRRALSLKAGVAQALVGQIERGARSDPYGSTVAALAAALGVDAGWLLTGDGERPTVTDNASPTAA